MPKGIYTRTKPAWNKGLTKADPRVAKYVHPRGHPFDEVNTYINPRGHRGCRVCRNEASRRSRTHAY